MTEISSYGMHDFFRDELGTAGRIVGAWDAHNKNYIISIQKDQQFNPNVTSLIAQAGNNSTLVGNNITLTLNAGLTGVTPGMNIYSYTAVGS